MTQVFDELVRYAGIDDDGRRTRGLHRLRHRRCGGRRLDGLTQGSLVQRAAHVLEGAAQGGHFLAKGTVPFGEACEIAVAALELRLQGRQFR